MSGVFSKVAGAHPRRSVFNLSYTKKFTCNMGELIPVMCDEAVPGDIFKIWCDFVIRFQPLLAPILHEVNVYVNYYFVPYRILFDKFEEFITGGVQGDSTVALPRFGKEKPLTDEDVKKYTLWDYFGMPTGVKPTGDSCPIDMPWRAFNKVYNDCLRNENFQDERDLLDNTIPLRNWKKDYFTSALATQQRGTAPSVPLSGTVPVMFHFDSAWLGRKHSTAANPVVEMYVKQDDTHYGHSEPTFYRGGSVGSTDLPSAMFVDGDDGNPARTEPWKLDTSFTGDVDLTDAATFDTADLRFVFQMQKWKERANRGGVRYVEFLQAMYGVYPRDDRLQRPEWIGGISSPLIVSEVTQNSSTKDEPSPPGSLYGKAVSVDSGYIGKYRVNEFGLILGILSIMPKPAYQQGINRQWLRRTRYDFFNPLFVSLSEQGIENEEIFTQNGDGEAKDANRGLWGFQGMYNEMRSKNNMVCADMRDQFDYWHLGRIFDSLPNLNGEFLKCHPDEFSRIFAVPSERGMIVNFSNVVKAIRSLPAVADPGLIDHH